MRFYNGIVCSSSQILLYFIMHCLCLVSQAYSKNNLLYIIKHHMNNVKFLNFYFASFFFFKKLFMLYWDLVD